MLGYALISIKSQSMFNFNYSLTKLALTFSGFGYEKKGNCCGRFCNYFRVKSLK